MLGAFHFGSISRESAIKRLWHLLLDIYKIDPSYLWVTYFSGDYVEGHWIDADDESRKSWLDLELPSTRIIGLGKHGNFWKQKPNTVGVEASHRCGPFTEVYFDRGKKMSCGADCKPGCDCGRFFEFASVLFISHWMHEEFDTPSPLDLPFTETVVGVERTAALTQKASSIFEIDSLWPLVEGAYIR